VGVSKLRSLNATQLRDMDKTLVIQENDQPVAVLLKYEEYLAMQEKMLAVIDAQSILSDRNAVSSILSGRADAKAGNSRPIEDVRESLKKNNPKT
jgi:PHD/YefM family antitoxin component YafN of YafNO toxin-antitoxin module